MAETLEHAGKLACVARFYMAKVCMIRACMAWVCVTLILPQATPSTSLRPPDPEEGDAARLITKL